MKFNLPLLTAVILIFLFACQQSDLQDSINTSSKDRLDHKNIPSDEFFMQRSYPMDRFSIDAFEKGLNQAKETGQSRSGLQGFDTEWTVQGPGNIGARTNTIAIDPNDSNIIYAGFAGGGVWKTTDGGNNWIPIFDDQVFLNIGDITIDPDDSQTIYVGTGDPNVSGYPKIGDGLYKSEDGGATWENLGLKDQRIISKVVLHPTESQTIFVSTMGIPFEKNNDRGLYRTKDGGTNWEQVLFLSDSTGVCDLIMHPTNPDILFAAGWDRIRNNSRSLVWGYGAKVYKSLDGGDSWELVEGGLPNDDPHSRLGLAISKSNPNVIYAQYVGTNFQLEAIYRSDDGGLSWNPIPIDPDYNFLSSNALGGFGWYFGKIRVNPLDENDIFLLGVDLWRSKNVGVEWERASPQWWNYTVHADKHDMIIKEDGSIFLATDGGIYQSTLNNTEEWIDIENIPTTQFYRVAYNPHMPDNYYGGAQDNGTTGGNAMDINDWPRIYGGDGFQMAFDTENPNRYFVETQNGNIAMTTSGGYSYVSGDDGIDPEDRKNWDMPYMISRHDNNILYAGTNFFYMGTGEFPSYTKISEDLTKDGAIPSRYQNITTLDESPITPFLLFAGTGDGNVWKSSDLATWEIISDDLPVQYVTDIVASPSDPNSVFVTYSGYRDNDFTPRIFRSIDQGVSWSDISGDLPDLAINELMVLPEQGDSILFVATDGGVYGTIDAGTSWERLGTNMPFIQVYDLVWNEAKSEIVAGTFARSIMSYPIDSILAMAPDTSVSTALPNFFLTNKIHSYPTLANDWVQIEIENIENSRAMELAVLDSRGKLIKSFKINNRQFSERLDVSNWPTGMYFIKAKMRHEIASAKFMIVR